MKHNKKKFSFRLEGLLKVREFKEDNLKAELGSIMREISEVTQDIENMKQDVVESYRSHDEFIEAGIRGDTLQFYPRFIQGRREDIKSKENILYSLNKKMEAKRVELARARGEVKVVEGLKDKEKEKFKKDKNKKEQVEVEELLQMRRMSQKQGEGA